MTASYVVFALLAFAVLAAITGLIGFVDFIHRGPEAPRALSSESPPAPPPESVSRTVSEPPAVPLDMGRDAAPQWSRPEGVGPLAVWSFDSPTGADRAVELLRQRQSPWTSRGIEGAVVAWPTDAKRPRTRVAQTNTGTARLSPSFWGLLFGLIFFVPLLADAIGANTGTVGNLTNVGIDDHFIRQVRQAVVPGRSALFVLSTVDINSQIDRLISTESPTVISVNLSAEQSATVRNAFSGS